MGQRTREPARPIKMRRLDIDLDNLDRDWHGNRFVHHFITVISESFPSGEQLFVNAVKRYIPQIKDPAIMTGIRGLIIQELSHSRMYDEAFDVQDVVGLDTKAGRDQFKRSVEAIENMLKGWPLLLLAWTVASEHLTATLSATLLRRPDVTDKLSPMFKTLSVWHAIEEIEHRQVAFDVYQAVRGTYWLRCFALVFITFSFVPTIPVQLIRVWREKQLFNFKAGLEWWRLFFGLKGFFSGFVRDYLAFYHPQFHPMQLKYNHLVAVGEASLAAMTVVKEYPVKAA